MFVVVVVVVAVVLFFVWKSKRDKADMERWQARKAAREQEIAERKKDGEPQVCKKMPSFDPAAKGKMIVGPDGKNYPKKMVNDNYFMALYRSLANYEGDDKYETSPLFVMMSMEYHVRETYLSGFANLKPKDLDKDYVERGLECCYEVAENYAYSSMADDDMTQAEHYTIRRLEDRKRAMEGNGYYKNVYEISRDPEKALWFYEKPEYIRGKYTEYFDQCDVRFVHMTSRCWMQTAHICAAGQDVEKAKRLYSQAYTMFVVYSFEDQIMELIHAMTSGYPRNPEDYQDQAYNMLADWACSSNLGLAMYYEYVRYANKLDKKRLAESPKSVVALCMEQAEDNHYAAYLLGRAMLYGYGIPKDEVHGRKLLELAASDGCISALHLLAQLSTGCEEEEKKWNAALYRTVEMVAAECAPMREQLLQEGKFVSQRFVKDVRARLAEEAAKAEKAQQQAPAWKAEPDTEPGFTFPEQITERSTGVIWQRDLDYGVVAIYRNLDTAETKTLGRLEIERLQASGEVYM